MSKHNGSPKTLPEKAKGLLGDRKKTLGILVIIILIGFGIWRFLTASKNQPQYQTAKVQKGTVVSTVSASGTVLTTNNVNITTSANGVVKDVFVKDGDNVQVGQKIMDIALDQPGQAKNAQAYSSYLSAKTTLDSASANAYTLRSKKDTAWKKFYDLATSSLYQNSDGSPREDTRNSSAEFQSAQGDWLAGEANYKNQQAVIDQAQQAISSSWLSYQETSPQVTAPISGTVTNITYVPGMVLAEQTSTTSNSNQRVAIIQNSGTPSITVNLSEVDVSKVKLDQAATVTLDSIFGKTFAGKVVTVDKIGTVTSNVTNYPAIIQFDTTSDQIFPNMAASANIIIDTKDDVLTVPTAAVQTQNGQSQVRILKNGQPQQVNVEVGLSSDTQTEIVSGLSEGEDVITSAITTTSGTTQQQGGISPFGGGGGFGGLRPGGGGGGRPPGD